MMDTEQTIEQAVPTHDLRPDETLYFLHIHKTAGSSLREYIYDKFGRNEACLLPWELPAVLDRPASELRNYRVIAGHYGYYLERLLGKPLVYITMLRDPVERTVSAFYDQRWREDLWLHEHIKDMTLDDYVFDRIGAREVMNFQTCSLAFDDVDRHYHGLAELWRDEEQTRAVLGDRRLLELAKARLERFAFVGLQDRFEDSLRLLAYTFGWPLPDRTPRENIRRESREKIPDRTLARIRELTALDQELYDFASGVFDARCMHLSDDRVTDRHREAIGRMPRQDEALVRFERGITGVGWQDRERTAAWAGRWTGPGTEASLHFPLRTGRSYTLFLRVGAYAPDIVSGLQIEANGAPLLLQREPCAEDIRHTCIRAEIGAEMVAHSPAFLGLTLRVPRVICPQTKDPTNSDRRSLGVYVQALELLPGPAELTTAGWSRRVQAEMRRAAAEPAG